MDLPLIVLNIVLTIVAALLLVTGTLNLAGFMLQVRSGEEDLRLKYPTFLTLIGIAFLGFSEFIAMMMPDAEFLQKVLFTISLVTLLIGTYLGLQKHANRYLDSKGEPLKVSFSGTHHMKRELRARGIRIK